MRLFLRPLLPVVAFVGALLFHSEAQAQAGGPQVHRLQDAQMFDFGQNLGPDLRAEIRNMGRCPIRVRWFDKQAPGGKWKEKVLQPGQRWQRIIEFGEYLEVHDVADHHDSVFGAMLRPTR